MACGIPVVTSETTSLPEVVGDAGIAVPPAAVDRVVEAMTRILDDPVYARTLGERGRSRAAGFSWSAAARETLAIYRQVTGQ
jgi:glycosyltransferase involved in cell wall biosynthesis